MKLKLFFLIQVFFILTSCSIEQNPKFFGFIPNQTRNPAEIRITKPTSLTVLESGTSIQIQFQLNKEPSNDIKIDSISISNNAEIIIDKTSLEFSKAEWNKVQILTVTGKDDFFVDGDKITEISFPKIISEDSEFANLKLETISITTKDNDFPGVVATPTSGLVTNESGATANFQVLLSSKPTADVIIPLISSSDTLEGTVSPATLTFTSTNWDQAQTVTVTGVDDILDDGQKTYTINFNPTTSSDPEYNGKVGSPVTIVNGDNELGSAITIGSIVGNTSEVGGTASFNIVLNTNPNANVTVNLSSNNLNEGTVSPSSITFTTLNWNTPVSVTVTGVNDFIQDGNITYTVNIGPTTSGNSNYQALATQTVSLVNVDNDTAGYTINLVSGYLIVSDGGEVQSTIRVNLNSQPTANVVIPITSSDTGEANPNVSSLTFTPSNWNSTQDIIISGVNDGDPIDGNKTFIIQLGFPTTTDLVYAALDPPDQNGTSCNNNSTTAKISVCRATPNNNTSEDLTTNEFYLIGNQLPTSNVVVNVSSGTLTEGTVSPASITINSSNWNQLLPSNRVVITGVNDSAYDGDVNYNINFGAATSVDPYYSGYATSSYQVTNLDNEVYFTVTPTTRTTTEGGATQNFSVVLPTAPTGNVTIPISSTNTGEGTIAVSSLVFTTLNWNTPQTVTITPINDNIADGNVVYTIDLGLATSADLRFNNKDPANVTVTNNDSGEKRTFLTNSLYNGNLGGKAGADSKCNTDLNRPSILPNTYKAMVAVSASRAGNPLADWVSAASTRYFQSNGTTEIMLTNASSVFTFGSLSNPFGSSEYWTGLTAIWGASTNCTGWTSSSSGVTGIFGDGTVLTSGSINSTTATCDQLKRILCVQQ